MSEVSEVYTIQLKPCENSADLYLFIHFYGVLPAHLLPLQKVFCIISSLKIFQL